jgi:pyroglutamyl-peptidase
MPRVLLTAYGPYDDWDSNVSWLVLQEVTRNLATGVDVITRLYPVDFAEVAARLEGDLTADIDVAIHLGQAPGNGQIDLEAVGINWARERGQRAEEAWPLVPSGPAAYQSQLPLGKWAQMLRSEGIPAEVSYHAGTYLCNAIHYLAHHYSTERGLGIQAAFLHLPLDTAQVIERGMTAASLPMEVTARGVQLILHDIAARVPAR